MEQSMMSHTDPPYFLLGYALQTIAYLLKRVPLKSYLT
jgi:hypothetical protein